VRETPAGHGQQGDHWQSRRDGEASARRLICPLEQIARPDAFRIQQVQHEIGAAIDMLRRQERSTLLEHEGLRQVAHTLVGDTQIVQRVNVAGIQRQSRSPASTASAKRRSWHQASA